MSFELLAFLEFDQASKSAASSESTYEDNRQSIYLIFGIS